MEKNHPQGLRTHPACSSLWGRIWLVLASRPWMQLHIYDCISLYPNWSFPSCGSPRIPHLQKIRSASIYSCSSPQTSPQFTNIFPGSVLLNGAQYWAVVLNPERTKPICTRTSSLWQKKSKWLFQSGDHFSPSRPPKTGRLIHGFS